MARSLNLRSRFYFDRVGICNRNAASSFGADRAIGIQLTSPSSSADLLRSCDGGLVPLAFCDYAIPLCAQL